MKKITDIFVVLIASLALFSSCENEPLTGEFFQTPDGSDPADFCTDAPLEIAAAQAALSSAPPNQQAELCDALQASITATISFCGDPGGALQALLNQLGDDCNVATNGGDDDDDDNGNGGNDGNDDDDGNDDGDGNDDTGNDDIIIGEWGFVLSRDFVSVNGEVIIDEEFLANDCNEQSFMLFDDSGNYSFIDYDNPGGNCEILSSTDSGNWINNNDVYQITYNNECVGLECPDQEEVPTSVTLIDEDTLRIQFGDDTVDDNGDVEFYFMEYSRI